MSPNRLDQKPLKLSDGNVEGYEAEYKLSRKEKRALHRKGKRNKRF